MDVPRRTGLLLVYAGTIGLATTFLVCVFLHEILHATRGWGCDYTHCTIPATWGIDQSRDTFLLWFGGVRSVLQIRAGMYLQEVGFDRKGPLVTYFVVAALDFGFLAALGDLPGWTLALVGGWPLLVYALTRTSAVRPLVWEPVTLPRAHVL